MNSENYKSEEYIEFLKTRISPSVSPEVASMMIEYALTEEEHKRTFDKIRDVYFQNKIPVEKPVIYLIVAQTGGGKSFLTASVFKQNPNVVIIDSDEYKAFNPRKDEITKNNPGLYGYLTGLDAYLHRDEIYNEALNGKYNILIEIAPSSKECFLMLILMNFLLMDIQLKFWFLEFQNKIVCFQFMKDMKDKLKLEWRLQN